MSHRYWDNFETQYLPLNSIFLDPASNAMTHKTWQTSKASFFDTNECGSRFPSMGSLLGIYLGRTGPGSRLEILKKNGNHLIFAKPFKNVLSFIFGLILNAVLTMLYWS